MKPPTDVQWIKAEKGEGLSMVCQDREGNKLVRLQWLTTPAGTNF